MTPSEPSSPIAAALIDWHARAGRHDLPWQIERNPYRVWVSEVMLQQTQVATVIPYFERFVARFADVQALAAAALDEVLHLWSGLGYYARARHLHAAARQICAEFGGAFPQSRAEIEGLPGIGRSTAGAILALSRGERHPILDGNVKRVLSRYFVIDGDPASPGTLAHLWDRSEQCTPYTEVDTYTQAIMDLGATLCTRRQPRCGYCPLAAECGARRTARQHALPAPRKRRPRPTRERFMVLAVNDDGALLLERRPASGIWGGLWCPPEFASQTAAVAFCESLLDAAWSGERALHALPTIAHAFTHFDLRLRPLLIRCPPRAVRGAACRAQRLGSECRWYDPRAPEALGLPAPIIHLVQAVNTPAPLFADEVIR